jgi:molybdopterin converting factor subunit 1
LDNVNTPEQYAAAAAQLAPAAPSASGAQPAPSLRLRVRYFALLREQAGRSSEELHTQARTPLQLYQQLRERYGLSLDPRFLRVAINDEFGDWRASLAEGDTVAFLPPVAGG